MLGVCTFLNNGFSITWVGLFVSSLRLPTYGSEKNRNKMKPKIL